MDNFDPLEGDRFPFLLSAEELGLFVHAGAARCRYLAVLAAAEDLKPPPRAWLLCLGWLFVDAWAWERSLLDLLSPRRRSSW